MLLIFVFLKKSCFVMVKHEFINIIVITILNHTLKQVEPSGFLHLSIMFPLILIFDLETMKVMLETSV